MASRLHELEGAIQRLDNEINTWRSRNDASESENARLAEQVASQRSAVESIDAALNERMQERTEAFEKVSQLETQLIALRQQTTGLSDSRNRAEIQLTRVDLRLENLITQVHERYNFQIEAFEPDYHVLMMTIEDQKLARSRGQRKPITDETPEDSSSSSSSSSDIEPEPESEPEPIVTSDDLDEDDTDRQCCAGKLPSRGEGPDRLEPGGRVAAGSRAARHGRRP
jgi:chromosome segregation protein